MDRMQQAIDTLHEVDTESAKKRRESQIQPIARLVVGIGFVITVISFQKYDLLGLVSMFIYIFALGIVEELSLKKGFFRMKYVMGIVCLFGIVNPFFDRGVLFSIGSLPIRGGVISMITLMIKGILTVYGAYFLVMTTGIDGICQALRTLHVPKGAVTMLLLMYRYIIVFLKEVKRMSIAYRLRAPRQRGIHIRTWGPFVGILLLRSMDRSVIVYESMMLRGYRGEFLVSTKSDGSTRVVSWLYVVFWLFMFLILRRLPIFSIVGRWIG